MVPKIFDFEQDLSEWFDSPVFKDLSDDTLLVCEQMHNRWYRYGWTHGRREIKFKGAVEGELPIMIQIYPGL